MEISELKFLHEERRSQIQKRLEDFKKVQTLEDKDIFAEFCFCLLTPQSKAFNCWNAVLELKEKDLLENGHHKKISKVLQKKVRFHNNKAKYIEESRRLLENGFKEKIINGKAPFEVREWLVENVKGYGYKEASHFLRNIGFRDLAILDRHILKNLVLLQVIPEIPKSLTEKKYFEIEEKFKSFSEKVGIPMDELDLLFWSMQAGKIFK